MFGAGTTTPWEQILENPSLASEEEEEVVQHFETTQIVELNVGGKHITTLLSTLTKEKENRLAKMFKPGQVSLTQDTKGRYFIDRNSKMFEQVLEFLRSGSLPSEEKASSLYKMAEDLGIPSLCEKLLPFKSVQGMIKINEIKRGPDAVDYESLKATVLNSLAQCLTSEDFMINLGNAYKFVLTGANYEAQKRFVSAVNTWKCICIEKVRLTEDIVACLVEELHALGYGKYIYITTCDLRQHCQMCEVYHSCTLLLSTHKITQYFSEGRVMYKQI